MTTIVFIALVLFILLLTGLLRFRRNLQAYDGLITAVATLLLAFVTVFLAFIAYWQYQELNSQRTDSELLLDLTTRAVLTTDRENWSMKPQVPQVSVIKVFPWRMVRIRRLGSSLAISMSRCRNE